MSISLTISLAFWRREYWYDFRCPTDPSIFPRFVPDGTALQSTYEAFRFTESYGVIFQCNVRYCLGPCEPVITSITSYSFMLKVDWLLRLNRWAVSGVAIESTLGVAANVTLTLRSSWIPAMKMWRWRRRFSSSMLPKSRPLRSSWLTTVSSSFFNQTLQMDTPSMTCFSIQWIEQVLSRSTKRRCPCSAIVALRGHQCWRWPWPVPSFWSLTCAPSSSSWCAAGWILKNPSNSFSSSINII